MERGKYTEVSFDFLKKYGERKNSLNGIEAKQMIAYSYKLVKIDLPELIEQNDYENVVYKLLKIKDYNGGDVLNFILWVVDELEKINKMEADYLSSEPEIELIQAGINNLNNYGKIGMLYSLSSNILEWKKILNMPYCEIFDLLLYQKEKAQIEKNYNKIITEQSKRKR